MIVDNRLMEQLFCHIHRLDISDCSHEIKAAVESIAHLANHFCDQREDIKPIVEEKTRFEERRVKIMFEALKQKLQMRMSESSFELARTNDVYRLSLVASTLRYQVEQIERAAKELVKEIERGE